MNLVADSLVELGRLPNLRSLVCPDPGFTLIDMDLQRADLWVVARESGDALLLQKLQEEVLDPTKDLHTANALTVFGMVDYWKRRFAKVFAHGTNYGSQPKKMASELGISIPEAARCQGVWFKAHQGIRTWHERTAFNLQKSNMVANKFGYRRKFFDRPDNCFTDALAWVPASTVALIINHALVAIGESKLPVELLLQTHDSLTYQCPTPLVWEVIPQLRTLGSIPVPYDPPLVIPLGFSVSDRSWGDVEAWDEWCGNQEHASWTGRTYTHHQ